MNFKNMSIKKSLIVGFGTTILVSLAIIVTALVMMSTQKAAYQDIIDHYVEANQRASECRIDYNIAARGLRDAVLSGEMSNLDTATAKMTDLETAITELNDSFPMDDKTQLNTFVNTMKEWGEEAQEIIKVARTDRETARGMIVDRCSPKLAAAAAAGDSLAAQLQAGQEKIIQQQNTSSTIGIIVILAVMVVATVAVVLMALKIIRSIVEPSNQVRAALVGFSQGNLGVPVSFTGKNELGEMCDALRTSQSVLHSVIQDISETTGQMAKGNFDVELTATFPGDLAPIQQSVNQFVVRMSDTITNISQSASQVSAAGQPEAEAKKENRKEADYHVSMDRLNTGTPTELDLTMEEAAQKGAQYLESLYGLDLEGAYVYMMYSPGTVTFPRAFWAADVLFEEAQTPESTRWNYLIDAVTGELFSIDHSRHLDASPSLEPDSALEKDYSAYAALAEEKVRTSGLMDGGIDRVEYNCQGYSGNDPVISLDVIGEKGEVLCIGFSRYDQSFLGLITDTSRKIREAVPKDVTGEGITEITEEYSSSSF